MSRAKPAKVKAYRVARHQCIHGGITYAVGDILPELSLDSLNVHLPNLELVEVDAEPVICPMPSEKVAETSGQFEEEPVYEV